MEKDTQGYEYGVPSVGTSLNYFLDARRDAGFEEKYRVNSAQPGVMQITNRETGEVLNVSRITTSEDPRIVQGYGLLGKVFDQAELDSLENLSKAADKPEIMMLVAEDAQGHVRGFLQAKYSSLPEQEGEGVVMIGYVVVDPGTRNGGLGNELYRMLYSESDNMAAQKGERVAFIAGEAVAEVEVFLNKQGRRRVYYIAEDGQYHEVPYVQPALDYNRQTGKPLEGSDDVLEHVMIASMSPQKDGEGRNAITQGEVMGVIHAIHDYVVLALWPRERFSERYQGAYDKYKAHVDGIFAGISNAVAQSVSDTLYMFTAEERVAMEAKGAKFVHHDTDVQWGEGAEG